MREECQKYGSVVSLLIPKENPGKGQVRNSLFNLILTLLRMYVPVSATLKKSQDLLMGLFQLVSFALKSPLTKYT